MNKILVLDDETGIIETLSAMLNRRGYYCKGLTNPLDALVELKKDKYDMLILDYLMSPIHGDKVVERIRQFDSDIYILLLTGHKDLAPPLETLKSLDIQGYCEKSDKFDQLFLLIESGMKCTTQMKTIRDYRDGLKRVLEVIPEIYRYQPLESMLENVLNEVMVLAGCNDAFILVDNVKPGNESFYKGTGAFSDACAMAGRLSGDLGEAVALSRQYARIEIREAGIVFPLINEYSSVIGVIYAGGNPDTDRVSLVELLARHAASSLNNMLLHLIVNSKSEQLNDAYQQLKQRYVEIIEALRLAVEAKDIYTRGHSERVTYYVKRIGAAFGLDSCQMELLEVAGIFHDIGKIGIPDEILLKTSRLDDREYAEIKKHPAKGVHILSAVSVFKDALPVIRHHHERIDGRGYPDGLKGEEIPFLARILSVADAFDAMTSDRLYRPRLSLEQAVEELMQGAGKQFDVSVVGVFVTLLDQYESMKADVAHTFK